MQTEHNNYELGATQHSQRAAHAPQSRSPGRWEEIQIAFNQAVKKGCASGKLASFHSYYTRQEQDENKVIKPPTIHSECTDAHGNVGT